MLSRYNSQAQDLSVGQGGSGPEFSRARFKACGMGCTVLARRIGGAALAGYPEWGRRHLRPYRSAQDFKPGGEVYHSPFLMMVSFALKGRLPPKGECPPVRLAYVDSQLY